MEMFNMTEMRQVLENQVDNPVDLNRIGVRMLETIDDMNKTIIQMDEKLEAELKEGGRKVAPTEEGSATLPTTPLRLPPMTTPGAPIRPRKTRVFNRRGFKPSRLTFDSPPSSPERMVVSSVSPAVSHDLPTPQAPLRQSRISRFDKSKIRLQRLDFDSSPERESELTSLDGFCTPAPSAPNFVPNAPMRPRKAVNFDASIIKPVRFSLDFSPERPAEDFPAAMNTPDRPYVQITPSAPVRSKRIYNFNSFDDTPIRHSFGSPPSSPESILESADLSTPERPAPIVDPQTPVQRNRFIKMDHFTASPIRLSFDSPRRFVLHQNQDHITDVLCPPKVQNTGYMKNVFGAPVRPKRIGRFSVFAIPCCRLNRDSSPVRHSESDLPSVPATPDRQPSTDIPQPPKKMITMNAWNIEPIPLSFDSDDE